MKKIMLIPIMLLFLISSVVAYDINDTLRINGEYKVLGVYTNVTDANITITNPSSVVVVDNVQMTYSAIGRWYYDYTIPNVIGQYEVIIHYTDSGTYKGNESSVFDGGDVNILNWNSCPTGTQGWVTLWIFIILMVILGIVGFSIRVPSLLAISGLLMLFTALNTFYCGMILGIFSVFMGLIFLIGAVSVKK